MSEKPSFFAELKRRNVYKVAVAYIVVGWALSQGIAQVFPVFDIPNWAIRLIVLLIIFGLPIAVVLAWMFELTPQGIKRTETADAMPAAVKPKKHAWIYVVTIGAAISIGLFSLGRYSAATRQNQSSSLPEKSIAVLPLGNLSRDPDNEYFAAGIQDEIITRLAQISDLKVISCSSTQRYKGSRESLRQIASELGVTNILEGSVQKASDQVHVNVQLLNAVTDSHLWADTFDRKLTDIFAVEGEIAKTIADTLQAKLSGSEKSRIAKTPTTNNEAHELYLKGRFFWNKRTAEDLRRSIDYFNQAIAKDPNYALAYAGLAQSWKLLPAFDGGAPKDCFPKAETAARKALTLDDTLSDAHAALASLKGLNGFDYPGAIKEYERALQLNPNDATAHQWFANDTLANIGQNEREVTVMKRAVELDPLSLIINANLGAAYVHAGRLDEAIAQLRKTVEMDSAFYYARYTLALALELKGAIPEAIAEYQKTVSINDDPVPLGMLGRLYATRGRKDEAQKILQQLRQRREQRYTAAYSLALVYLGLGDRNEALKWLEESYRERDGFNIGPIRIDPLLAPLQGDPRFEALAEKIVPAAQFGKKATTKQ